MKKEKKIFSLAASSSSDSIAKTGLHATAGGSCHGADTETFFVLKKPIVRCMSPALKTAAAVRLSAPPPAVQEGRCGAVEEAAAKRLPVAGRVIKRSLSEASCNNAQAGEAVSLQSIRVSYKCLYSLGSSSSLGVGCRRKLSACSRADKLEALQRAHEKLVWKGCAIDCTSSSRGSTGGAGSIISRTMSTSRRGKAARKTKKGLLRGTKRQIATSPARHRHSSRKSRASRTGTRKRRRRKCRRKQLTAAQREARRACLMRKVRVSPQLLDVLLHTSGVAKIVHRQKQPQHDDFRQLETGEDELKTKEKQEVHGADVRGPGKQGKNGSGEREQQHRQIRRGNLAVRMSRPVVTRKIWQYVREQQLVMESVGCTVHADERLQQLFGGRMRVNLFKVLQSLLVPHLLFYENTDTPVPAAEDMVTSEGQTYKGKEGGERANEESCNDVDSGESEEENDDLSTVSSPCASYHLNRYPSRCTQACGKSRCEVGERMKSPYSEEEVHASVACKSDTASGVEGAAAAGEGGVIVACPRGTGPRCGMECPKIAKDEKEQPSRSMRSSGRSSMPKKEQWDTPVEVKRLRPARYLSPSGSSSSSFSNSSTSSDTSRSEDGSSSSSSDVDSGSSNSGGENDRASNGRSQRSWCSLGKSRKRLIKEVWGSSGRKQLAGDTNSSRCSGRTGCKAASTRDVDAEQRQCTDDKRPSHPFSFDATAATGSRSSAATATTRQALVVTKAGAAAKKRISPVGVRIGTASMAVAAVTTR